MALRYDRTGFNDIVICQDPEEFCYGTDAVILAHEAAGSAMAHRRDCAIADLGTGTGIVPLILSQKTEAGRIMGIEVQKHSFALAEKNRRENGLDDRISFVLGNVKNVSREYGAEFDIVTSNPPYTAEGEGIESGNSAKAIARHEILGTLDDFLKAASIMLKDKGEFYMIHRPGRIVDICQGCRENGLEPREMTFISGKPGEKPNLLLIKCVKNGGRDLKILPPFAVRNTDGSFTEKMLRCYDT